MTSKTKELGLTDFLLRNVPGIDAMDHQIDAATRALDEGQSEGLGPRLVIDLPRLMGTERRPVDDETRRQLRGLGLPDIIIDRWTQSQADMHLRFSNGSPFDPRLVAQDLAEIEEESERKRFCEEMMRQLEAEKRQALEAAPQAVEEVMPPEYEAPLRTPAAIIAIEEEAPPPAPAVPERIEEPPSLPLDRADPADIEARNLQAALDHAKAGIPVFPARLKWKDGRWKKKPIIKGWQAVSADPKRVLEWWRMHPEAVPGIPLGRPHLVAIDCDRHGGSDGIQTFSALAKEHGGLPSGPITATVSGGLHFIFKQPSDGKSLGNSEGAFTGRGINVRGGHSGWIVAPGAVCPDGSMWRTADDSLPLIEAHRDGSIPTIPPWIVDMIRPPPDKPKKAPKAKAEAKETKPSPSAAPSSSKRKASIGEKKNYAAVALESNAAELAKAQPGGRNNKANAIAYRMGRMVPGRIDRSTVSDALFKACEQNKLVEDDGADQVRTTIESGLNAGMLNPLPDLADDRSGKQGRRRTSDDPIWQRRRRAEIFRLLRVRPYGEHATIEAAEDVLAGLEDLDANELGKRLNFTLAEYKAIGARFDRHPATIAPCDATREQVDEHLAAVRDAKKPERAVAEKNRRLRKKLEREQQQPPATLSNELVARRCTAIVGYSKRHPGPHPTHDLVGGLKRWEAFADATFKTIRNVIDGLLRLAAAGKLPALSDHLTISRNTAKNRRTTYTVEYRK